jgi:hypothetical protein
MVQMLEYRFMAVSNLNEVIGVQPASGQMTATAMPKTKVVAATGGAALGSAFSVILIWILQSGLAELQIEMPPAVLDAFTAIFTALAAFAAGYYTPPGVDEGVVVDHDGKVKSAVRGG